MYLNIVHVLFINENNKTERPDLPMKFQFIKLFCLRTLVCFKTAFAIDYSNETYKT